MYKYVRTLCFIFVISLHYCTLAKNMTGFITYQFTPPHTYTLLPLFEMFVVVSYNEAYTATTRTSIRSNKRTLAKETSIMSISMYIVL